jgi:Zn-dependent protease with chaperone function
LRDDRSIDPLLPNSAEPAPAVFFDGVTNRKRHVALRFGNDLEIIEKGEGIATWPYPNLRHADGPPDAMRLSCISSLPLARLEIRDPATKREIFARSSSLVAHHGQRRTHTGRIVLWSLAALASISAVTYYGVPLAAARLAPLVPYSFERRVGEMADNQVKAVFGGKVCAAAGGRAAYAKMVETLRRAGNLQIPLQTEILNSAVPNAFALPGGKVYLFEGLLRRAENPDELAGVLAHELGHVIHRDHMRILIQNGGTSFLVGLLFGDVTGAGAVIFATRSLLEASYTRGAETDADAFAIDVMHKLGRSPKPMGELLFRITGAQADKSIGILASHPMTEDRLALMTREDRPSTGPEILTAREWQALKAICR